MIFHQLFDSESSTYTYLLGSKGKAVLIDSVREHVDEYVKLLSELGLTLTHVFDTHVHADHITGSGLLRQMTGCEVVMGNETKAEGVTIRLKDGDTLEVGEIRLTAMHTPGHTEDSYSFLMEDRVFTGDTLLINATGRTDFQNGDASAQFHSLFDKLLKLPAHTKVYPAHDYQGKTVSTIGHEIQSNPRLQVSSEQAYIDIMSHLLLDKPRMIDIAVPENLRCGV